MKDVRVLVKDVQTGESFCFGQIAECARHFNLSQSTVSNRIKNRVLTGRRWLFEYEDEKRQAQIKKRAAASKNGEKICTEKVPSSLVAWKVAAQKLRISPERLYAIIRKKGIKGYLYVDDVSFYPRRYYKWEDIKGIKEELELKHNAALKAVIAFNKNINNGRIYHFTNIYVCRCVLKKNLVQIFLLRRCTNY